MHPHWIYLERGASVSPPCLALLLWQTTIFCQRHGSLIIHFSPGLAVSTPQVPYRWEKWFTNEHLLIRFGPHTLNKSQRLWLGHLKTLCPDQRGLDRVKAAEWTTLSIHGSVWLSTLLSRNLLTLAKQVSHLEEWTSEGGMLSTWHIWSSIPGSLGPWSSPTPNTEKGVRWRGEEFCNWEFGECERKKNLYSNVANVVTFIVKTLEKIYFFLKKRKTGWVYFFCVLCPVVLNTSCRLDSFSCALWEKLDVWTNSRPIIPSVWLGSPPRVFLFFIYLRL